MSGLTASRQRKCEEDLEKGLGRLLFYETLFQSFPLQGFIMYKTIIEALSKNIIEALSNR